MSLSWNQECLNFNITTSIHKEISLFQNILHVISTANDSTLNSKIIKSDLTAALVGKTSVQLKTKGCHDVIANCHKVNYGQFCIKQKNKQLNFSSA